VIIAPTIPPLKSDAWTVPALELRHLRYFLAVVEEGHFGRAAEKLHMTQPPLSQRIQKLERELGVQLLHRTSRSVIPTEAGEVLAEQAQRVLTAVDRAVAETRRTAGVTTPLRIGCSPFIPIEPLRSLLAAVREQDPAIRTRVTYLVSGEQCRRVMRGDLDVAIFHLADGLMGFASEPLFPGDPLAAYFRPGHRLEVKSEIRPPDVVDEILVTYPRPESPALHDRFYGTIEAAGYHFASKREASGPSERDLLLEVAEGRGVLLASYCLKDMTEAGREVVRRPLSPAVSLPDAALVWAAPPPAQLGRVLTTLRTAASELYATARADAA
jgi:DNA-binding transcriptional LysR family regulator